MRLKVWLSALVAVGLVVVVSGKSAVADDIAAKAEICAACHGADGTPVSKEIPNIWGQAEGYLYLQMRDMKNGDRKNEQMEPILADLSREDLHALASYFAQKTWPRFAYTSSDQDRAVASQVMAAAVCSSCHLEGFKGDSTAPRVANQQAEYLYKTMIDFRSKARANNPFMTDLLNSYKSSDIEAMARYLAAL